MTTLVFTLLVGFSSFVAGLLGALTGLGGGVVLVPTLALLFGVDIRYAIGASLVSVIATSSGSASAYVKQGYSNIRIGMFLEIATTIGALAGAFLSRHVTTPTIALLFGLTLLYSAYQSFFEARKQPTEAATEDTMARKLKLNGTYPSEHSHVSYSVRNVPLGFSLMFGAGALSGLLGIGSGAVKVLAMDRAMGIPFKVSTTTSNFMIGVTAAASAAVYLRRGYIEPALAMPVMLGVLGGAMLGTKILDIASVRSLRRLFGIVIFILAIEMIFSGLTGRI